MVFESSVPFLSLQGEPSSFCAHCRGKGMNLVHHFKCPFVSFAEPNNDFFIAFGLRILSTKLGSCSSSCHGAVRERPRTVASSGYGAAIFRKPPSVWTLFFANAACPRFVHACPRLSTLYGKNVQVGGNPRQPAATHGNLSNFRMNAGVFIRTRAQLSEDTKLRNFFSRRDDGEVVIRA